MPTVKLLKPFRLSTMGRVFERGAEVDVDLATARALHGNPRFEVKGLLEAVEAAARAEAVREAQNDTSPEAPEKELNDGKPVKPATKEELYAAIREAADQLDPDDESNFTATGKPQVVALEKILGYDISADDRDHAIMGTMPGKLDEGEDKGQRKGGVKIISKKKNETEEKDPSTSGAVEV